MQRRRSKRGPEGLARRAAQAGVRDQRLLGAIEATPRREFVPRDQVASAERDEPLPIGMGQTTSQPSLIAMMVQELELRGGERVLEVGTGHGWQTALLARLAGHVHSIERYEGLARVARENLAAFSNVDVVVGDGTRGLPDAAPFDAIIVAAATEEVPFALAEQLEEGGVLVAPVGARGHQEVRRYRRRGGELSVDRVLTGARFVPLVAGPEPPGPRRRR